MLSWGVTFCIVALKLDALSCFSSCERVWCCCPKFVSPSQVFSLDDTASLYSFYGSKPNPAKDKMMENLAEQIATLCDTLKEYPAIRYRKYGGFRCKQSVSDGSAFWLVSPLLLRCRGPEENARLAEEVYQRLNAHKADNPSMGEVRKRRNLIKEQTFFTLCWMDVILGFFGELILQLFTRADWICLWSWGFISWFISFLILCCVSFALLFSCPSRHFLAPKVAWSQACITVLSSSFFYTTEKKHHPAPFFSVCLFILRCMPWSVCRIPPLY